LSFTYAQKRNGDIVAKLKSRNVTLKTKQNRLIARDERKQLRRQNTAEQNFQPKTPSGIMQKRQIQGQCRKNLLR